jgi:ESCRT-II complex subunit VPS36
MLLLEGVALTDSGRPVLAPEELELRILEKTDAEFGERRGGLQRWARLWYASSKILP